MGNRVLNMLVLTLAAFYFLGISQVSSHAPGNTGTFLYWFDAYLASTSDKCGQQKPISGRTVTSQRCDANGDTARPCPGTDAFYWDTLWVYIYGLYKAKQTYICLFSFIIIGISKSLPTLAQTLRQSTDEE